MRRTLILIPPSEGKASGGSSAPLRSVDGQVQTMIDRLHSVQETEWPKLLGVKGAALDQAVQANRSLLQSPTLPAIERYTGVVYSAIDYAGMTMKAQRFFEKHVRIISAVFGLVAPQDALPDYKLKIDKLKADKHWQPHHAKALAESFVIDLLPKAHQKAISYDKGIQVDFVQIKDGKRKPAGHQGKHIKGRFVRWLCEHQITDPEQFGAFQEDGFHWDGAHFVKNA